MPVTAENLRAGCAREISLSPRGFGDCDWLHEAFMTVPREHFVPDRVWWPASREDGSYPLIDRSEQPRAWLKAVYAPGAALITQIDDGAAEPTGPAKGAFTSSISASAVVIELLRHLAPRPGDRILEIGTGTGYTTALLIHRAGDSGVVTVEIDDGLSARAATRLDELRLRPTLVVADGEQGYAPAGPYDRIVATASVRQIPRAWLEQLRPGGVLVAPMDSPYGHDLLVHLTGDGNGSAHGHFLEAVTFMPVRGQRAARPYEDLGWMAGAETHPWEDLRIVADPDGQQIRCSTPTGQDPRPRSDTQGGRRAAGQEAAPAD
ncbi:methyltransferase domain-containing protein [Streptomyces niveus]|uniref:methyltransferase domain-containing protein n=1 Tax=Streptomyces niveus TaxID=193462 RepID=UPI0036AFB3BE